MGLLLVVLGGLLRWGWVRNFWFRALHCAAIVYVAVQALVGIACPLTIWENWLREAGGQSKNYEEGGFIQYWLRHIFYYEWEKWVFTTAYVSFGLLVVVTMFVLPPRVPWRRPQRPEGFEVQSTSG